MTVELCLFRHGRTEWNALGRYQGVADVDLDELGLRQAQAVARRCREMRPASLYSSDLRRCADTADAIAAATGVTASLDTRLRERDVGEWSGLTRADVLTRWPDDYEAWMGGDEGVRPGGGESVDDVVVRAKSFVTSVGESHADGVVVAATHAGWIRALLQWILGPGMHRSAIGVPAAGSLTVVRIEHDASLRIEAFNDRGHLLEVEDIDREAPAPPIY